MCSAASLFPRLYRSSYPSDNKLTRASDDVHVLFFCHWHVPSELHLTPSEVTPLFAFHSYTLTTPTSHKAQVS